MILNRAPQVAFQPHLLTFVPSLSISTATSSLDHFCSHSPTLISFATIPRASPSSCPYSSISKELPLTARRSRTTTWILGFSKSFCGIEFIVHRNSVQLRPSNISITPPEDDQMGMNDDDYYPETDVAERELSRRSLRVFCGKFTRVPIYEHELLDTLPQEKKNERLTHILRTFALGDKYEDCERVFATSTQPTEEMMYITLKACADCGQPDSAFRVLRAARKKPSLQPDTNAYNYCLWAFAVEGRRVKDAIAFFKKMKEIGVQPNQDTYEALIKICGKCGKWQEAYKLFEKLKQKQWTPSKQAYESCVAVCRDSNQWDIALKLLNEMEAEGIHSEEFSSTVLLVIYRDRNMWEPAVALIRNMRKKKLPITEDQFTAAVDACSNCGRWKEAQEMVHEMRAAGFRPIIGHYNACLRACIPGKHWNEALDLLHKEMRYQVVSPNSVSYANTMLVCEAAGQLKIVMALHKEMKQTGTRLTLPCYETAIKAYMKSGKHKTALSILKECQSYGLEPDMEALRALLKQLKNAKASSESDQEKSA